VRQRFDVRKTTSEAECEKERLLSVIEGISAGFERFNEWMHNLLVVVSKRTLMEADSAASRHPDGNLRHFRRPRVLPSYGGATRARDRSVHPADISALEAEVSAERHDNPPLAADDEHAIGHCAIVGDDGSRG
jgi:hypothetical protein